MLKLTRRRRILSTVARRPVPRPSLLVTLNEQQVNRRQFLRGGGARRWLRRRLTPRWWPVATTGPLGKPVPAARLLERLSFPRLMATLVICAFFVIISGWLPGWLLATAWLATALGLAWLSDGANAAGGGRAAACVSQLTLLGRLTQRVRAAAGGIVIAAGLAVIVGMLLRFAASATVDIVSSARSAATAGLAIGLWRPSFVLPFTAMLGRAAGKLRKAVLRFVTFGY